MGPKKGGKVAVPAKVLFVTAVGGYRDPLRAAAGAAAFGIAESLWSGYSPLEWRDAWMFALLAAMLVLRAQDGSPEQRKGLAYDILPRFRAILLSGMLQQS